MRQKSIRRRHRQIYATRPYTHRLCVSCGGFLVRAVDRPGRAQTSAKNVDHEYRLARYRAVLQRGCRMGLPPIRPQNGAETGLPTRARRAESRERCAEILSAHLAAIVVAAFHCGACCTLADIVTEFTIFALGLTLFGQQIWASFVFDFAAAWLLGIVFQYFTIAPMRNLSLVDGLVAAIKADTLSITAFQVGMYAWMALVYFVWFPHPHLHPTGALYWLLMQIGMIAGFFTSYPMNAWLIRRGLKEAMG